MSIKEDFAKYPNAWKDHVWCYQIYWKKRYRKWRIATEDMLAEGWTPLKVEAASVYLSIAREMHFRKTIDDDQMLRIAEAKEILDDKFDYIESYARRTW